MDNKFLEYINFILVLEGGYSNNKNDKGGVTNNGITQKVYSEYRKRHNLKSQDVKYITNDEVKKIYYEEYYVVSGADKIENPQLSFLLFDTAINCGPSIAKKFLQQSEGDVNSYLLLREKYYDEIIKRNPTQKVFRQGWNNRLDKIKQYISNIPSLPNDSKKQEEIPQKETNIPFSEKIKENMQKSFILFIYYLCANAIISSKRENPFDTNEIDILNDIPDYKDISSEELSKKVLEMLNKYKKQAIENQRRQNYLQFLKLINNLNNRRYNQSMNPQPKFNFQTPSINPIISSYTPQMQMPAYEIPNTGMVTGLNHIYDRENAIAEAAKLEARKIGFEKVFGSDNKKDIPLPSQNVTESNNISFVQNNPLKPVKTVQPSQYFTPNPKVELNQVPVTPILIQSMGINNSQLQPQTQSIDILGGLLNSVLKRQLG